MLLKLLPEQVVNYWDMIEEGLEANLPPIVGEVPEKMSNILEALITDEMQCWVSVREDTKEVVALLLTTVVEDKMSKSRSLLLYLVWTFKQSRASDWIEGFQGAQKFAKLMKCHRVISYATEPQVLKIAEKFGADFQTFISFPVFTK